MTATQGGAGRRAPRPVDPADDLPAIPATAWAVLGLLSFERELSGYDIKQWADAILRFFYWSPATSQIYAELRRLEDLGLVVSHVVARDDVRGKRVYRITPAGREALERWQLETDAEASVLKHGLMLRLWLGHLAPPDRLREQIEIHRDAIAGRSHRRPGGRRACRHRAGVGLSRAGGPLDLPPDRGRARPHR